MAIDYQATARQLVNELGGEENISKVTHCATRLRFILKDESKVDSQRVSQIPGVITTVKAGGQFQVVIGNHVADAYRFVNQLVKQTEEEPDGSGGKVGIFSRIIDVISSIFAPFLYTLAACGILQGILGVLVALNWIDTTGGTYQVFNFISWTAFTFLPVLIAITAAKKFNMNVFIAVVIACALVSPDYINMVNAGDPVHFFGMQIHLLSYTSTVIPIILAVWIASYLQRFLDRYLPSVIRNLFSPLITIAVMVPLTLLAFGPVGDAVGSAIGGIYNYLYDLSPIIAGVVVGGLWEVLVIFGVHWGITPVTVGNYASLGYDTFTGLQASAVFSQAGAAFGVVLKSKNKEMKKVAASAGVTGLFGITEPAIYGVNLRLKKPMICACIAGAVGGGIGGAFRAVSWSYNMPGIATLPAYFKAGHLTPFLGLLLSIAVSFVLGAVLTYLVGFREDHVGDSATQKTQDTPQQAPVLHQSPSVEIGCPVKGLMIPLEQVKDEAFASGALGQGVGILPEDGIIYSPFKGRVEMLADTGHAVALKNSDGVEVLLHLGIDTIKLNGNGFRPLVKQGDLVRRNDPLIEFDRRLLKEKGYDPTVIVLVTDQSDYPGLSIRSAGNVGLQDAVITVSEEECS